MGCGTKCIKISLIIFNIFFWLLGLGILGVGIWIKVDQKVVNFSEAVQVGTNENIIEIITWIFIGAGIFVFCVGFFGCCGAVRESKPMLGFYMTCIVIVFAAEVGAGIYAAVKKDMLKEDIKQKGAEWIKEHYDDDSAISKGLNFVQLQFCCCGMKDFMDYQGSEYVKTGKTKGAFMSFACCKSAEQINTDTVKVEIGAEDKEDCIVEARNLAGGIINGTANIKQEKYLQCPTKQPFNPNGCVDRITDWAEEHMIVVLVVGIVIGVIQLIGFVLACCLCRMIGIEEKMN